MEITVTRGLPAGGRQIRLEVFVREQGFTEASEFDDVDPGAWHAVIWENGLPDVYKRQMYSCLRLKLPLRRSVISFTMQLCWNRTRPRSCRSTIS